MSDISNYFNNTFFSKKLDYDILFYSNFYSSVPFAKTIKIRTSLKTLMNTFSI